MYVHTHICMCIYKYIDIYTHTHTHVHIHICACVHIYPYLFRSFFSPFFFLHPSHPPFPSLPSRLAHRERERRWATNPLLTGFRVPKVFLVAVVTEFLPPVRQRLGVLHFKVELRHLGDQVPAIQRHTEAVGLRKGGRKET